MNKMLGVYCQKILPLVYDDSLSYYELLCKVTAKINELIDEDAYLRTELSKVTGNFEDYHNIISGEVSNILRGWLLDGTLSEIIGKSVFMIPFVPTGDIRADYKRDTLNVIASYLTCAVGVDSLTGKPYNTPEQCVFVYNQGHKNLRGLLYESENTEFDGSTIIDVGGVLRHVAFIDCSTFVSLVTKCIPYLNSPYYHAFTVGVSDIEALRSKYVESGGIFRKPYTFDFKNYIHSFRMAYIMESSGNRIYTVSKAEGNNFTIDESVFNGMETGDIIFVGNTIENSSEFYGISHTGYYLKNLADLDEALSVYGVKAKPYDNDLDGSMGYIVHVAGSATDEDESEEANYMNVLRIQSLASYAKQPKVGCNRIVYTCKPYANAMNSNKAYKLCTGVNNYRDYMTFGDRRYSTYGAKLTDEGIFTCNQVRQRSLPINSVTDANDMLDGVYHSSQTTKPENILNMPPSLKSGVHFHMIQWGRINEGEFQTAQVIIADGGLMFTRVKLISTSRWQPWSVFVGTVDDGTLAPASE